MDTTLNFAGFDEKGIIIFQKESQPVYNIYEAALQAMVGEEVHIPYREGRLGLQPRYYDPQYLPDPVSSSSARAALNWLIGNGEAGPLNSLVWTYKFDLVYRGVNVPAPWISSFGQAYAALAFLHWYRHTDNSVYLDFAVKGARLFAAPQSEGGVTTILSDGGWFFEEIPAPASTQILNAHLISLLVLHEVSLHTEDPLIHCALGKGLFGLDSLIDEYDTGTWSRYDRPQSIQLFGRLVPHGSLAKAYIGEISITAGQEKLGSLDAADDAAFADGDWRISGIDWGAVLERPSISFRGRELIYGHEIHASPVPTGTRQNTYILIKTIPPDDRMYLNLEIFADGELTLDYENRDLGSSDLRFHLTDKKHRILLKQGINRINIPLTGKEFGDVLSLEYHRYHHLLLDLLSDKTSNTKLAAVAARFRQYEENRRDRDYPAPECLPELPETVFVSVNTECGLHCKMCDIGIENTEASLFKNLKTGSKTNLDPDLLIQRCIEAGIKKVHFIGTEPLLYTSIFDVLDKGVFSMQRHFMENKQ